MTPTSTLLLLLPLAYLAGSIPFGLLVGWTRGIDVRKSGSGNIGATNVGRLLGRKFFWIVFVLDMLKGMIPSLAAGFVLGFHAADTQTYLLWLLVGFASIFGHMFSPFLGFKGGKGVATSVGALVGMWPFYTVAALIAGLIWIIVFKTTRYVSAASIIGITSFPIAFVAIGLALGWPVFGRQLPLLIAACALAALIVYKHRANIARLLAGTENRAGARKPEPAAPENQR